MGFFKNVCVVVDIFMSDLAEYEFMTGSTYHITDLIKRVRNVDFIYDKDTYGVIKWNNDGTEVHCANCEFANICYENSFSSSFNIKYKASEREDNTNIILRRIGDKK